MSVEPDRLKKYLDSTSLTYKTRSNSYIFQCPRCLKNDKLYIRRKDGAFVCFKCKETSNFKGKPEYALAELLNLPVHVVQEALYDVGSLEPVLYLEFQLNNLLEPAEELEEYFEPKSWPFDYYPLTDPKSVKGVEYLATRGIPLDLALEYGIRFAPSKRRVVFPVIVNGVMLGWQERLIIPSTYWDERRLETVTVPKALTSEDCPRDQVVMFGDRITGDHVVLCEGPIDAIHAHMCGGNVASLGKAVSRGQLDFIRRKGIQKVYLALDPDALDESARLIRNEFADLECYLMHPPARYGDLGDMPLGEVFELFKSAPKVHRNLIFAFLGR